MKTMVTAGHFLFFTLLIELTWASWNNLNCPAPRAPDNGLSFIFRNGELVHFRCHPGYYMIGKSVAYCVNNQWTEPTPECASIRGHRYPAPAALTENVRQASHASKPTSSGGATTDRNLFNWEERVGDPTDHRQQKTSVYGDGPRRLPLINGIWPPQQSQQVMTLGPQSTPGPRNLVKEEVDIAELRHKQQEEVKRQRITDDYGYIPQKKRRRPKKDRRNRKNRNDTAIPYVDKDAPRETVISLGSTEDGDALSVAFAKVNNDTEVRKDKHKHHYRHDGLKKRRRGKDKKWRNREQYSSHIVARASRVDNSGVSPYANHYQSYRHHQRNPQISNEVAELRGRPVERIKKHNESSVSLFPVEDLDTTCMESLYGHNVPMIAPQVDHAFVYRYETRKNHDFPFNSYMQVKYRCLSGYHFIDHTLRTLNCRQGKWIGNKPECVKRNTH